MSDEEKDFYIKGKIKEGYIPEKIDNLFNNSIKIIENKGEKTMEKNNNENIKNNMNQNNQSKKMPVALKRILATVACLTILLGGNIYAKSQGYDNIFFMIKYIITGQEVISGMENILSDREINISYERIDISEKLSVIIESLVVEENQAKLNLKSFHYRMDEKDEAIQLKYEIRDKDGKILCIQEGKKPNENLYECKEQLIINEFSDNITKLELSLYNNVTNNKIAKLEIDLENKEVIISEKDVMEKVSEVELKKYLSSFAYLVTPWEIWGLNRIKPESFEVEKIMQSAIDLGIEKGILKYSDKGYSAEEIQKIANAFIHKNITYNNIQDNIRKINDTTIEFDGWHYRLSNSKPIYYQEVDGGIWISDCLTVDDINYSNGVYQVTFIHYYWLTAGGTIDDQEKYKTTMSLKLNEDTSISKYSIVEIGETKLITE